MKALGRTLVALVVAVTSLGAITQRAHEQGVTDTEISIGNLMPYTGSLQAFGPIVPELMKGAAELAETTGYKG